MRQYDMKAEPGEKMVIELKVTDQTSIRVWVIEGKNREKHWWSQRVCMAVSI